MIYIYTVENDTNTNLIVDWLRRYNAPYKRINGSDFYRLFEENINHYTNSDVHWFWKWHLPTHSNELSLTDKNRDAFYQAVTIEKETLFKLYFDNYAAKTVNHPSDVKLDKYSQLKIAKQCGLQTPESIVTSSKEHLKEFEKKYENIITKNLRATLTLEMDEEIYQTYTSKIANDFIETVPTIFFPSFFQEFIESEYELRVIYIGGQIFSCAIFSKRSETVDIREVVNSNEAYLLPYKIPLEIEQRICDFMNKINLQIGSLDLLYTPNNEYVFLEVNPSGQFQGYSTACNYNIEKQIAEYLIKQSNDKD